MHFAPGRWLRCLALISAVALPCASAVAAGNLQVSNTLLELQQSDKAQGLWLSNDGDTPLRAQARVQQWTQGLAEGDQLANTHLLAASPPIVEIAPGDRQFVRVVRLQKGDVHAEQSYRLLVSELPSTAKAEAAQGVQLLVQHSIPVFVIPEGGKALGGLHASTHLEPLRARLTQSTAATTKLQVSNAGAQRVRISRVDWVATDGHKETLQTGLLGYVLAGQTMQWTLPLPEAARQRGGRIDVRLNDDAQPQTLLQIPAG